MLGCKGLMGTGKFPGKSDGMLGAGGGGGNHAMHWYPNQDKMMLK